MLLEPSPPPRGRGQGEGAYLLRAPQRPLVAKLSK
jgi:hypothetical protein